MVYSQAGNCSAKSTCGGFSLPEALVAIVIAAVLAVALVRVAANSRMNAGAIQELVRMKNFSDALLAQTAPTELGVTHGRAARFSWHVTVSPLKFTATALRINSEPVLDTPKAKPLGLAALLDLLPQTQKKEEGPRWLPVYVTMDTDTRAGRRYSADTIRMVRLPEQSESSRPAN